MKVFSGSIAALIVRISNLSKDGIYYKHDETDMLKGYVQGYGVDYRLKPDAWASQTIADKHSK